MPKVTAHRMEGAARGAPVSIRVDGRQVEAYSGEMLAAALMAAGIVRLRSSPSAGTPRGAFCLMGVCQECLVRVDGRLSQACMVAIREGLAVELAGGGQ